MSQKRKCQNLIIESKAEILQKHLYESIKSNELVVEHNIPASTISTWKTCRQKLKSMWPMDNKKRKRMYASPYKDVKLALLYWLKEMRSRDVPPPLTKEILRTKANIHTLTFNSWINYIDFYIKNSMNP